MLLFKWQIGCMILLLLIRESLAKLGDEEYTDMAYEVAMCHHERWERKETAGKVQNTVKMNRRDVKCYF